MTLPDEEKIARIRHLYEVMNRGDRDAAIEMAHPEAVLVRVGGQGELQGPEALRAWMEPDAFEEQVLEPLEFEAANDRVLVRVRTRARGAGSGIEMEIDAWSVYTFARDGRFARVEIFLPHEEEQARRALAA